MAFSLTAYNTFGIAATCDAFTEYTSVEALQQLLPQLRQQRWLHIGAGSNLLFVHPHFEGTILHSAIEGWEIAGETTDTIDICAGAGEEMDAFVAEMIDQGYYGLENLSHIPGEVGASAVQNVGAYGVEAGDFIVQVEAVEVASGRVVTLLHDDCHYAYRFSNFKGDWRGKYVITHVTFRLNKVFRPVLSHKSVPQQLAAMGLTPETAQAADLRRAIIDIRSAKLPDPKVLGSAGSFFMNPIVKAHVAEQLLKRFPQMPHYTMPRCEVVTDKVGDSSKDLGDSSKVLGESLKKVGAFSEKEANNAAPDVKIPAGWLIEQAGWKGRTLGNAGVHPLQALVLINKGGATGAEVAQLAAAIQQDVQEKFGIALHPEVMFL